MTAKAFKILPYNLLKDWGEFESWSLGIGSAPDGWIAATAPTCARESKNINIKYGTYSLGILGGSNNNPLGGVYRTIPEGDDYAGRTFKLGLWVKTNNPGVYIQLWDGVSASTIHHSGGNTFEELTITKKLDSAATQIWIGLLAPTGITAYFDSGVLCEGEDLFTNLSSGNIAVSDWQPSLNIKQDQYEIARREGIFIPEYHLRDSALRLVGNVVGTDFASCRTNFDTLMKSLLAWQRAEKRNIYLYDDRILEVFLKTFSWEYFNSLLMIKFNLAFSAPDSTMRYISKLRNRKVISGTITEFNFAYNGNADSKPIISFIADQGGAITTCSLENLTAGESLAYTGTVPQNVALDIDCDLGVVNNSGIDKIVDFTGDFLRLVRGTNYFKYSGSPCTINIDYFERWF